MATARTYGDGCATAHALDVVGERWALLVVRELLLGPKRFTDLRAGLPAIGPNVLAQRLRELEETGVVGRTTLPPPAASRVYELTAWGRELEGIVLALGRWGSRSPALRTDLPHGVDSLVLALKTLFDPAAAGELAATYELDLGSDRFLIAIEDGSFDAGRATGEAVDAAIRTDVPTLEALVWKGARPRDALAEGTLAIEGDRRAARRFFSLFPLGERADSTSAARRRQPSSARATSA